MHQAAPHLNPPQQGFFELGQPVDGYVTGRRAYKRFYLGSRRKHLINLALQNRPLIQASAGLPWQGASNYALLADFQKGVRLAVLSRLPLPIEVRVRRTERNVLRDILELEMQHQRFSQ